MRKILKNTLCLILIISFYPSCSTSEQVEYKKMKNYLIENFPNYDSKKKTCVLLLTENGCIPCNRLYAKFIEENFFNKNNSFIIVCASGSAIDISPFILKEKISNVYEDPNETFRKEIFPYSSAIFLNAETFDTLIQITSKDTEQNFEFILSKFDKITE